MFKVAAGIFAVFLALIFIGAAAHVVLDMIDRSRLGAKAKAKAKAEAEPSNDLKAKLGRKEPEKRSRKRSDVEKASFH